VRELDEEQGVQAGYLAHGFVEWDVPPSGQGSASVPLRAPLLLYPISVHARTAAQVDVDVEIIGDVELRALGGERTDGYARAERAARPAG
jgi:hypothetical protein